MTAYDTHAAERRSQTRARFRFDWLIRQGAVGGVAAGLIFAFFFMLTTVALHGAEAIFAPLRLIGAIILGREALDPTYSILIAGLVGAVLHTLISALYGMIFWANTFIVPQLSRSAYWMVAAAAIYGLLIWLINFYVVAPLAFPWFLETNQIVQFFGHIFLFGVPLGLYLSRLTKQRWQKEP